MEIILAFDATSVAIAAEQTLLCKNIEVRVMPLPFSIRAGCGICLRVDEVQLLEVVAALNKAGIHTYALYTRCVEADKSVYTPYKGEL